VEEGWLLVLERRGWDWPRLYSGNTKRRACNNSIGRLQLFRSGTLLVHYDMSQNTAHRRITCYWWGKTSSLLSDNMVSELSCVLTFIFSDFLMRIVILHHSLDQGNYSSAMQFTNTGNWKGTIWWSMKIGCFLDCGYSLEVSFLILLGLQITYLTGPTFHLLQLQCTDRECGNEWISGKYKIRFNRIAKIMDQEVTHSWG